LNLSNNQLTSLPPELIQLDLKISPNRNRFCRLPNSIAKWIDEHISSTAETNWMETQKLDDAHLCDGTLIL